ncbi:MAG: sel1 repeat family protein, partial [Deltaproteobacteria bacterium]|nr:sel1 repeat family protein [Deltaproteobacteria bacterium]
SAAAGKPVRERKLAATLIKVAAVLCIVAGVGYALTKKNSNGIKTPWERLMERKEVLTAEDHSMGEQAPAQQQPEAAAPMPTTTRATITTTATTTAPAPTTAPNDDSSGLDPQVEASLLEKCGGDVEFCYRNGVAFVDDKKYKTAAHFFEATCKINYGPGCAGMAQLFANGNGVEQSYAKAMEFYQKSCDIGFGSACLSLGFGFAKGITGAASPEKALEAFQKACDKDLAEACTQAGYAYVKGEGVGRAPARAAQLFGKACRMNDSVACDEAKKVETNK